MSLVKHIPNTITTLNLLCGVVGVVFAFQGRPDWAFYMMLAASIFDFCDGASARLLNAYSPMGKELDSLCDVVSFGVLPSILLYANVHTFVWQPYAWLPFVPLIVAAGSALRLAKFNVDDRQHESFLGLATPVSALLCGSLCSYVEFEPNSLLGALCSMWWFVPVLSVLLFALMVCEIPMFSMKFAKGQPKSLKVKRIAYVADCVVIAIGVLCVRTNWALIVFLATLLYIIKNLIFFLPLRRK